MVATARWAWIFFAGVLFACGGTAVSGTSADAGGSGGHSNATGGAGGAAAGGSSVGTGGSVAAGGSSAGTGGCPAGYADCNGDPSDGCEANLATDPKNCGKCGFWCSPTGSGIACNNGGCAVCDCPVGHGNCDNNCANGCEIDLQTDANNCGFCGNVCSVKNGTPACTHGKCSIAACNAGYADCDAKYSTGCETDLSSDVNNCGACGRACQDVNGALMCVAGSCLCECPAGYTTCGGNCNCLDLVADPQNCGSCGHACASGQSCVSGVCQ